MEEGRPSSSVSAGSCSAASQREKTPSDSPELDDALRVLYDLPGLVVLGMLVQERLQRRINFALCLYDISSTIAKRVSQ